MVPRSAPRSLGGIGVNNNGSDKGSGNNNKGGNKGNNSNNNNNRIALALMGIALSLYAFGLIGSALHLPSPVVTRRRGRSSWIRGLRGGGGLRGGADGANNFVGGGTVVSDATAGAGAGGGEGGRPGAGAGTSIHLSRNGISDVGVDDEDVEEIEEEELEEIEGDVDAIPISRWPVSISDEDGYFEDVVHPGHKAMGHPDVIMSVPRFWVNDPVSVHNNVLMTRDIAMRIGSCASHPSGGIGDDCPLNERTIYVAIASYRDWQCRDTVNSIFSRAIYPERVRVAVTDQIVEGEDGSCDTPHVPCVSDPTQALCVHRERLDVFRIDAKLSIGPVFARHMGHRMYRGEYYYMQADAHVTFTRGWDVDIIKQQESTGNEMAVLSTYLTDIEGSIDDNGNSLRHTRPIMCNTDYEEGQENRYLRHGSQPEDVPTIHGMPQLEPYWAAGFSFSRGHFVVNVPYDFYQPMIFQGEEMSIGIRGFTIGYDYYAPERSVCFHHYADGENKRKRNKVPHYWENGATYSGSGIRAMYRLLGIVRMNPEIELDRWDHAEEDKYGLGGARTPELFYDVFGIDVKNKVAEQHLCRFVESGLMHKQFMDVLRPDGMGIDYSKITFRFKGPA